MKESLNSLFVIPNLNQGGSQKLIINLINNIQIKNKSLFVYKQKEVFLKSSLKKSIKVQFSKKKRIIFSYFEINNLIKKKKINLVFSCIRNMNIILGLYAFFFNKKVSLIFHEPNVLSEFTKLNFNKYLKLFFMKLAYKNSKYIIANSIDTKKDLLKFNIVPASKITVISNPISVSRKKLDNLKKIKKFINNRYTIIGCGELTYQKNFELLIKAYELFKKKYQNTCLIIIGDGILRNKLSFMIKKMNLEKNILITGLLKNPYNAFKLGNMFVLSSRYEGFGNVLIEAIFAKLSIVSTRCPGGPKEILQNGKFGFLSKNHDQNDLSKKLIQCYNNPKKINLKYFKDLYSSENISKKYLKLFLK